MTSHETSGVAERSEHLRLVGDSERGTSSMAGGTEFYRRWRELEASGASREAKLRLAFDYCHGMVFATASRITGGPWDAEDVTQSVFEQLARRLAKIQHPAAIPSFLKTTAVRMSLRRVTRDRWRRRKLRVVMDPRAADSGRKAELAATVRQLLAQLEPQERAAVVLKYVEMHSHEEVADLMGVSIATARRRLASGRAKLVVILGEERVSRTFGARGGGE